jgi:hypothetical protein
VTPADYIRERWRRPIIQLEGGSWTKKVGCYLRKDLEELSSADAEDGAKVANPLVLYSKGTLYFLRRQSLDQPRVVDDSLRLNVSISLLEGPSHLLDGWDPENTVSVMLGLAPPGLDQRAGYALCRKARRLYDYWVRCHNVEVKATRSEAQTWQKISDRRKNDFDVGDAVWILPGRVRQGSTKKAVEPSADFRCKLQIEGSRHNLCPWDVCRLKPRVFFPVSTTMEVKIAEQGDFDLFPEGVSELEPKQSVYEMESIRDVRWVIWSRTSRRVRENLVRWKGCPEPERFPVSQLNCGTLQNRFNKGARAQARAMQSEDDPLELCAQ